LIENDTPDAPDATDAEDKKSAQDEPKKRKRLEALEVGEDLDSETELESEPTGETVDRRRDSRPRSKRSSRRPCAACSRNAPFAAFPLSPEVLKGLAEKGYEFATPVQAAAIEPAIAART
jgi:hypothetical protein